MRGKGVPKRVTSYRLRNASTACSIPYGSLEYPLVYVVTPLNALCAGPPSACEPETHTVSTTPRRRWDTSSPVRPAGYAFSNRIRSPGRAAFLNTFGSPVTFPTTFTRLAGRITSPWLAGVRP